MLRGLEAAESEVRLAALDALAGLGTGSRADKRLFGLLDDPDPSVRQRAVQALAMTKEKQVAERLLGTLADPNLDVCRTALGALSEEARVPDTAARIVELMFRFSGELRIETAATLRRLGERDEASGQLLAALGDPAQEDFHWICIDALAELYAPERRHTG